MFSIHNGFRWVGGFAIGCGGAFGNVDLENYKMAKNIAESFKNTAILLSRNESVPDEIIGNASKSIMPASLYLAFGQLGWYFQAIKYRTLFKLWDKPYVR